MSKTSNLYDKTKRPKSLNKAWNVVHSNGVSSRSAQTRQQIRNFELDAQKHLQRIYQQLHYRRFKFLPSEGILQPKPGKSARRPIVKSPIENRIVQRAILDVLQSHPPLKPYFQTGTSFGGIQKKGVSDALEAAYNAVKASAKYYIRSDIKSFFTQIPKQNVISIIESVCKGYDPNGEFLNLFQQAVTVELSNLDQLGKGAEAFPIFDIGVAQGSCLSPLLGNIVLSDFDNEMNSSDITCLRYIDDFIIFAPTHKAANAAMRRAHKLLQKLGLDAYLPSDGSGKADFGLTAKGFAFLGCDVRPGMIRPDKATRTRLIKNISKVFQESLELMRDPEVLVQNQSTLVDTLREVSNILKGWGNQYSYCNDYNLLKQIDNEIDEMISDYLLGYTSLRKAFQDAGELSQRRRLLGVHLLMDSKRDPIIVPHTEVRSQ